MHDIIHSALLQNSPCLVVSLQWSVFGCILSLQRDTSPSPYSQDAELSTPQCCKTALPRCFVETEPVWLYFRRCKLTLTGDQAGYGPMQWVFAPQQARNGSLQPGHGK
jgi:hypothetical protein